MNARGNVVPPSASSQPSISTEEMRAELGKITRSSAFRGSPVLQRFLEYVGSKALEGLSAEIKEYAIGREVLGRPADYDPQLDTVVRVHAHRLREKLEEYYQGEGSADEILLEIPKGHYIPRFSRRMARAQKDAGNAAASAAAQPNLPSAAVKEPSPEASGARNGASSQRGVTQRIALALGLTLAVVVAGLFLINSEKGYFHARRGLARAVQPPNAGGNLVLAQLWAGLLKDRNPPLIAYSNSVFLATQTSDLLRLKDEAVDNLGAPAMPGVAHRLVANPSLLASAGPVFFEDVYTGTGEVMAVFYLTRMFDQFHSSIQVERSRLVSIEDLRRHNVVFLGSTREDALLAGLPLTQDFVFAWPRVPVGVWDGRIVNRHPRPGEPSSYEVERDRKTGVVEADYALVSFLPGIAAGRKIVILGGLTTLGTQGAAEFATSPAGVSEMLARLGVRPRDPAAAFPPYFQAVLKVEIMKDEVLRTKCVAAHLIHTSQRAPSKS